MRALDPLHKALNPLDKALNHLHKALNPLHKALDPLHKALNPLDKALNPEQTIAFYPSMRFYIATGVTMGDVIYRHWCHNEWRHISSQVSQWMTSSKVSNSMIYFPLYIPLILQDSDFLKYFFGSQFFPCAEHPCQNLDKILGGKVDILILF